MGKSIKRVIQEIVKENASKCPFCGSDRVSFNSKRVYDYDIEIGSHDVIRGYIRCNRCHARGPVKSVKVKLPYEDKAFMIDLCKEALNGWNIVVIKED